MEAVATLPTYIPLPEAARRYGLSEAALRRAVENGIIRGGMLGTQMLLVEEDVRRTGKRMPDAAVMDGPVVVTVKEPRLISIEAASRKYDIHVGVLEKLIDEHRIRIENNGERLLFEEDVEAVQHLSRKQFKHLEGKGISINEASRRYNLLSSTVTRWAMKGKIRTVKRKGKYRYIDESDIAYAAMLAKEFGMRKRKGVLPDQVY